MAGAVSSVRSRRVRVRCGGVRPGKARQVWRGLVDARIGRLRYGGLWHGRCGLLSNGEAWWVLVRHGLAGQVRSVRS